MPIYAYRCTACGHSKDVLQKMSDAPLSDCPACGAASFVKQLTAAGFQLKGSGWYVTDFRDKGGAAKTKAEGADKAAPADAAAVTAGADAVTSKAGEGKTAESKGADAKSGDSKPAAKADKPAAPAPSAPSTPTGS